LTVKSAIKAGKWTANHNQSATAELQIRTNVQAGRFSLHHNQNTLTVKSAI